MIRGQSNLGKTTGKKKPERLPMTIQILAERKLKDSNLSTQGMRLKNPKESRGASMFGAQGRRLYHTK